MKVFIERENKTKEVKAKTIKEILEKLRINPETVLTVVNNELVTDDRKLNSKDEIKILSVVSGG
ncbi:MAG: MoaD/ThiS family protein [Nanoarchaeota archaeon]|nr:MoaD/ThiS family protein [Nanoarchaeota archaeon]